MVHYRKKSTKIYFVLFVILFFFWMAKKSQSANANEVYCVSVKHANTLYVRGYEAYEQEDWVYAHELLSFYYLLTANAGALQRDQVFMKELIDAKNYARFRLAEIFKEKASLSSQLQKCQSKSTNGIGQSRRGLTSKQPKPKLRARPPMSK